MIKSWYPPFMVEVSILNLRVAHSVFRAFDRTMMNCPLASVDAVPSIATSASPSMIRMSVSKGRVFGVCTTRIESEGCNGT